MLNSSSVFSTPLLSTVEDFNRVAIFHFFDQEWHVEHLVRMSTTKGFNKAMATVIEVLVPTEDFALEETRAVLPDVDLEIERIVAGDPEQITPYVWACADATRLATA